MFHLVIDRDKTNQTVKILSLFVTAIFLKCFLTVVTCDVPALTTELQIFGCTAGGSVDYDTTCQYTCTLGYNLIGQDTVTCNEDGMFSANTPRCDGI